MGKIVSDAERERRRVENSVYAYVTGTKNLNWIVGIIHSSRMNKGEFLKFFSSCQHSLASKPRFKELEERLKQEGYI